MILSRPPILRSTPWLKEGILWAMQYSTREMSRSFDMMYTSMDSQPMGLMGWTETSVMTLFSSTVK